GRRRPSRPLAWFSACCRGPGSAVSGPGRWPSSRLDRGGLLDREGFCELLDLRAKLPLELVRELLGFGDLLVDGALCPQVLAKLRLEPLHLVGRDAVEEALVAREARGNLLLERPRVPLRLVPSGRPR